MRDVAVADRALEGEDDVRLAAQLGEPAGPEPPVEGDERFIVAVCLGHPGEPTGVVRTAQRVSPPAGRRHWVSGDWVHSDWVPAGVRCGGQVGYGTRPDPLRAAAFRP